MNDKHDELLDRLFSAVRSERPDTAAAEAHFETRLMARLEERHYSESPFPVWAWRLMPWFATIVVLVGIGALVCDPARSSDLFAAFTNGNEGYVTTSLLAGG